MLLNEGRKRRAMAEPIISLRSADAPLGVSAADRAAAAVRPLTQTRALFVPATSRT